MGEAAGDDRYVRKGAIVDLEPAEAQRFPNKFKLYEAPAAVEAKPDAVEAKPDAVEAKPDE